MINTDEEISSDAVLNGNTETMQLLIENGFENVKPMHKVAVLVKKETGKIFLKRKRGADVNAKAEGLIALHPATISRYSETPNFLINRKRGFVVNARNFWGKVFDVSLQG